MRLNEKSIVVGCNYHTTWQSSKSMRFVLKEVKDDKARLVTRNSRKDFWAGLGSLIFILTPCNIEKAKLLCKDPVK